VSSVEQTIHKGLAGVVVDTTSISTVDPASNSLTYRGYPVPDLAATRSFEEVAFLLWYGELPSAAELADFKASTVRQRGLSPALMALLSGLPPYCHPMDVLRTAVSLMGAEDPAQGDATPSANQAKALRLFAQIPTVVAIEQRRQRRLPPIPPDPELGFAANFFNMCFGEVPDPEIVRAFETSLILYAEHSFNASTFTARVVTSTLSDMYSAVVAAIAALKGPLHGGANEAVMRMFQEIHDPESAAEWLEKALARKEKIMGFGHRVYKHGDSRVPTMRKALEAVARQRDTDNLLARYIALEHAMYEAKKLHPNLDYPSGPTYFLMGFDVPIFTPIFVMSRITGWTAHVMEQVAANTLIRPLAAYVGVERRAVPNRT
jgi:citrate synthase